MSQQLKKIRPTLSKPLPEPLQRIIEARHHNPFDILGLQKDATSYVYRAYKPGAWQLFIETENGLSPFTRLGNTDFFEWRGDAQQLNKHPALIQKNINGADKRFIDPYSFPPKVDHQQLNQFNSGSHWHCYRLLGNHQRIIDNTPGVEFLVWAPNAERVSIVGDFNHWDGRANPMANCGDSGVWFLFIPGDLNQQLYKYEIRNRDSSNIHIKSDPYAKQYQMRPDTASIITGPSEFNWSDQSWLMERERRQWLHSPASIYELHLGSWQRDGNNNFLNYRDIADRLVPYVQSLGFNYIQLMPVCEYPYDGSWGYQVTGYFAPTSRHGSADDLRYLIDLCHQHHLGVLLDWVPAHFPKDAHGLARFDGSALYEHEDPKRGEHRDWGTLIFNYGRNEVKNFLLSSAFYWLDEFHIDGLRVDAVASMLYLNYSREDGDWTPNIYGGKENLEAMDFIREANTVLHQYHPGVLTIAEESTSWPMVSHPVYLGGLGFSMKWNMGWMNDTLSYIANDPIYRQFNHDKLTFGLLYAFTENFVLPFSHDEVVHGKRSILGKMPGDEWQRFANVRLLYGYQFTQPGKKLLFMGCEFAQGEEWNFNQALDWHLLDYSLHQGVKTLVTDLNKLYLSEPALHQYDFNEKGFHWLDCHDSTQSVLSYLRYSDDDLIIVVLNFTPVVRHQYRVGVPKPGHYREILNTDSVYYGGSDISNGTQIKAEKIKTMGQEFSISLSLPPLGCILLKLNV